MKLHVTQWERYIRPKRRWIIAAILILFLLIWGIVRGDWWGVLVFLVIIIAYAAYEWRTQQQMLLLSLDTEWVSLANEKRYRNQLQWFSLWFDPGTEDVQTIFLYTTDDVIISSPDDSQQEISDFLEELKQHIPYIKQIQLSGVKKVMRVLKI